MTLGKGPFVMVYGGPVGRIKSKFTGTWDNAVTLYIQTFVIWIDTATNWLEADCEDRVDLLEKEIADALLDHRSQAQDETVPWDDIVPTGETILDVWKEGERLFWTETITVKARKLNG
jgi:hypothetical protein